MGAMLAISVVKKSLQINKIKRIKRIKRYAREEYEQQRRIETASVGQKWVFELTRKPYFLPHPLA
jgi:hypothetical protein